MEKYFSIIGAQRCGTTYLYHILNNHPEIEMAKPLKPEPKFFLEEKEYKKGRSFYLNKYFPENISEKRVIGEKSTSYIEFDLSDRIQSFFPKAKIIAMLRNPVERAISNYYFSYNNGLEQRTLTEVFLEEKPRPKFDKSKISVSPYDYIERGFYSKYLKTYLDAFGKNIKLILFEDLINSREKICEVFEFLSVNKINVVKGITEKQNEGTYKETKELKKVKSALYDCYQKEVKRVEEIIGNDIPQWNKRENI